MPAVYYEARSLKSGEKRYYVRSKVGDERRSHGGFRTLREAQKKKHQVLLSLADGSYFKSDLKNATFGEFAETWQRDYVSIKVKPRTQDDYRQVTRIHLEPFFGNRKLKDIDPVLVQDYVSKKSEQGLSPRTINKTITILKLMFKWAEIWGYLETNPAKNVIRPRAVSTEMDFLDISEVRRLLDAASPEYDALFATAVLTGAREGELLGLLWGDFDPEKAVLYIRRSYNPKYGYGEPKTAAGCRAIKISPELIRILSKRKANSKKCSSGDPIFQNREGKPLHYANMLSREFFPALERAGIRRIRFHDLRHTYAAVMLSMGENPKFIQRQLGHANIGTTLDQYGHLLPEVSAKFGERLDTFLFSTNVTPLQFKKKAS